MIKLRNFTWTRFFGGLTLIAGVGYLLLQVATLEIPVFTFIAAVAFGVIYCSLGEWLTHGMLYHAPIPGMKKIHTIHHEGHHFTLFPTTHYTQQGKYEFMQFRAPLKPFKMSTNFFDNALTIWSQNLLAIAVGVPVIMAPTFLMTEDSLFRWTVVGTVCFIACFMTYVHGVIHTPRGRLIERQKWFLWLDRHHYIHHIDITANINFLLPICDIVFGTQKWASTDAELARHPTFEQAKPMAYDVNPALNLSLADDKWAIDRDLAAAADRVALRGAPLGASMSMAPLDSYAGIGGNPNLINNNGTGATAAGRATMVRPSQIITDEDLANADAQAAASHDDSEPTIVS